MRSYTEVRAQWDKAVNLVMRQRGCSRAQAVKVVCVEQNDLRLEYVAAAQGRPRPGEGQVGNLDASPPPAKPTPPRPPGGRFRNRVVQLNNMPKAVADVYVAQLARVHE